VRNLSEVQRANALVITFRGIPERHVFHRYPGERVLP
jgi:hypothetical protein